MAIAGLELFLGVHGGVQGKDATDESESSSDAYIAAALWPWQLSNYFSTHVARKKRLMIQNHRLLLLGGLLVEIGLELFIGECGGVRCEDATDESESSSIVKSY